MKQYNIYGTIDEINEQKKLCEYCGKQNKKSTLTCSHDCAEKLIKELKNINNGGK